MEKADNLKPKPELPLELIQELGCLEFKLKTKNAKNDSDFNRLNPNFVK